VKGRLISALDMACDRVLEGRIAERRTGDFGIGRRSVIQ
jgi:hypothetical protein